MKHLSVCASTCVYWAQLTRPRMFETIVLRSHKDLPDLLALFRASQNSRIPPIYHSLQHLHMYYTLGDHQWLHLLAGLKAYNQVPKLARVFLRITGPATPAFMTACSRGSILHPLFFSVPRILPILLPPKCDLLLVVENIHMPSLTVIFNLVQDCLSLRPRQMHCSNVTWDRDHALPATPFSVGLKYACRGPIGIELSASGCTDDILVASMMQSIPHHEFSQRRWGPHLSLQDTSHLFDVMHTATRDWPTKLSSGLGISSSSNPDAIQRYTAAKLPPGVYLSIVAHILDADMCHITTY